NVIALEMLSATQALDLLAPLKPAAAVRAALECIRQKVPFAKEDRIFSKDVEAIKDLIHSQELLQVVQKTVGELEW
ncbi:MAG TPA: hypothetical protein VN132_07215, partial [Bdellovibrio sp.]|nr:hypothetical protein [Bdellovibrio sp.]